MKIDVNREEIEAEVMLKKKVVHLNDKIIGVLIPKKYLGQNAVIFIEEQTGSWTKGMLDNLKKRKEKLDDFDISEL